MVAFFLLLLLSVCVNSLRLQHGISSQSRVALKSKIQAGLEIENRDSVSLVNGMIKGNLLANIRVAKQRDVLVEKIDKTPFKSGKPVLNGDDTVEFVFGKYVHNFTAFPRVPKHIHEQKAAPHQLVGISEFYDPHGSDPKRFDITYVSDNFYVWEARGILAFYKELDRAVIGLTGKSSNWALTLEKENKTLEYPDEFKDLPKESWTMLHDHLRTSYPKSKILPIYQRYMTGWWTTGPGWCGEMTLQSAALYFGSYIPQLIIYGRVRESNKDPKVLYDPSDPDQQLRSYGDQTPPKTAYAKSWVLNPYFEKTHYVIEDLGLEYLDFHSAPGYAPPAVDSPNQIYNYTRFIKDEIDKGHVVMAGWMNSKGNRPPFHSHDHILPIVGYRWNEEKGGIDGLYYNDLFEPLPLLIVQPFATRAECNDGHYDYWCISSESATGISVQGNEFQNEPHVVPARLELNRWNEPECLGMAPESCHLIPKKDYLEMIEGVAMKADLIVQKLSSGSRYVCYRYNDLAGLPTHSNFADSFFVEQYSFVATGSTHTIHLDDLYTDEVSAFRCMHADGPKVIKYSTMKHSMRSSN